MPSGRCDSLSRASENATLKVTGHLDDGRTSVIDETGQRAERNFQTAEMVLVEGSRHPEVHAGGSPAARGAGLAHGDPCPPGQ